MFSLCYITFTSLFSCLLYTSTVSEVELIKNSTFPLYDFEYSVLCKVTSFTRNQAVAFYRNKKEICQVYNNTEKTKPECVINNIHNYTTQYQCSCEKSGNSEKIYKLKIKSFKLVDATQWSCFSIFYYQRSNYVALNYGPEQILLIGSYPQFAADGKNTLRLVCQASVTNCVVVLTWVEINRTGNVHVLTQPEKVITKLNDNGYTYSQAMTITPMWFQDGNTVRCLAKNINVSDSVPISSSIKLDLIFGPASVSVTGNQVHFPADGNKTLKLICKTTVSKVNVTFKWMNETSKTEITDHVGNTISTQENGGHVYSQYLTIKPVWYQDGDVITCQVKNKTFSGFQAVTSSIELNLLYGPEHVTILSNDADFVAHGLNRLSLTCKTSVTKGQVVFKWVNKTSQTEIKSDIGETKNTSVGRGYVYTQNLTLTPHWYQHDDVIVCEVTNKNISDYKAAIANIKLNLAYGPTNVSISGNKAGFFADGVQVMQLICKTSLCKVDVIFKWINETSKTEITDSIGNTVTTPKSAGHIYSQYLNIKPVWYQDGDVITCQVQSKNISGVEPVTSSTKLDLKYVPQEKPVIKGYDSGVPIREGEVLKMSCQVTGGKPLVSDVIFVCDGINTKTNIVTIGDLKTRFVSFQLLRIHHNKICQCTAKHVTNKYILSTSVSLFVNYAPTVRMSAHFYTKNKTLQIRCEAEGRPADYHFSKFTHMWRGEKIRELDGQFVSPNRYVLSIRQYSYKDSGTYVCAVTNNVIGLNRNTEQLGKLAVISEVPPSSVDTSNSTLTVSDGDSLILKKIIVSRSRITYFRWVNRKMKVMKSVINETDVSVKVYNKIVNVSGYLISLDIGQFSDSERGLYNLTVCNKFGCDNFYTYLKSSEEHTESKFVKMSVYIVTAVLGVIILIIVVVVCVMRKRRKSEDNERQLDSETQHRPVQEELNTDNNVHDTELADYSTLQTNTGDTEHVYVPLNKK